MYSTLVISGGGINGVAAMGCIAALQTHGFLDNVKTVIGSSVGSFVGAMFCMDLDMRLVFKKWYAMPHKKRLELESVDVSGFMTKFGLDGGEGLDVLIEMFVPPDLTFDALRRMHGRRLLVHTTCLTDGKGEVFGPDTHPNMSVAKAIRMSCSIPLIFCAVKHDTKIYVDGGVTNNFPMELADASSTLGISMKTFVSKKACSIQNMEAYLGAIVHAILGSFQKQIPRGSHVITIQSSIPSTAIFTATNDQLLYLYNLGYHRGLGHVKKVV
jgi:NTE family protein